MEKKDCPLCEVSEDTIDKLKNTNNKKKYLQKKEKKEQERLKRARSKKSKKIFIISLLIIFIGAIFVLVGYFSDKGEGSNQGPAKIEIVEKEYDAGTVSMADGLVKYSYEIKSIGQGDLKISSISTSCMCTTVRLIVGDKKSPEFGMHDNPIGWSYKIPPGETGYLEVVFDPAFHGPQGTGTAVREIYFSTNDPQNEKSKVRLMAEVVR